MEAALDRFRAADTQVLGISVDSVHSHANWAASLGGISFPLLSDFEPKGAVARSFGHYLDGPGISDRATVIVDKQGVVRYSESVTPAGRREVDDLLAACQEINGGAAATAAAGAAQVPAGATLYVKSQCGPSRRALLALDNLHLSDAITVKNVTEDAAAAGELEKLGKVQAPCLVVDGKPIYEAVEITKVLADRVAPC